MNANSMEEFLNRYPPTSESIRDDRDLETREDRSERIAPKRLPLERTIDLHGLTTDDARVELDRFIESARTAGVRKILIVHGKGNHRGSGGVLKKFVQKYLEMNPTVGATGTPAIRDGGSGATWAVIRQRSR